MSKIVNVILSGGSGTRLWPLSRKSKPKQFLKIFNDQSLFQHTIKRNTSLVDDFLLITNKDQIVEAAEQTKEIDQNFSKVIIEPVGRNTAPAIALAAFSLEAEDILFVTPCDHMIPDDDIYRLNYNKAIELARKGNLVTFGIKPYGPDTGFGYIEYENENVISFREKPDYKTAKTFFESGQFLWNSGMFCFKAEVFLEELQKYNPAIFEKSKEAFFSIKEGYVGEKEMLAIPEDSIDYAVFEKSKKIKTVPSSFDWTDLGTFDSLITYVQKNINEVDCINKIDGVDTTNSFFVGTKKAFGIKVSDLIVVDTDDCILIMNAGQSQQVKALYNEVKEKNKELIN
ncbi:hypothetical protein GCM10009430_07230 [Aquimarina litoralis]|uniref:Nucleotidyl transferase domain-containing protein n=1 Tax=Aquimarina litoralis TaxID=584605 RepID=A0ABN1II69_9FLAO